MRGPGGVSVPGATVQLTNPQTGERKETWTDEAGNYTFTGLAPGIIGWIFRWWGSVPILASRCR